MLFPKRTDFTPTQTAATPFLGTTFRFELTREFHIEAIEVVINFTNTAVMATDNADLINALLNRVTMTVADGAQNRNVVDVSGAALLDLSLNWIGGLDAATAALYRTDPAAASYTIRYPIWFAHPQISDPIGSTLLLPAPRYNTNPVVTVQIATQAQMDTNVAPTFALSALTCYLVVHRRQVNRADFPIFNTELQQIDTTYTSTGTAQRQELPIPGSYTGILLRDRTDGDTKGSIQTANGENRLQILGTVLRRFRVEDVLAENERSLRLNDTATWNNQVGNAYLDFLTDKTGISAGDLGSVLDANMLQASGARVELIQDITSAGAATRQYITHRVFGNLKKLKF